MHGNEIEILAACAHSTHQRGEAAAQAARELETVLSFPELTAGTAEGLERGQVKRTQSWP